jgi:hypothetical protein
VVEGFFAVHPRAVGDSLEKGVIILFTKWLIQLTDTAILHPDLGSVPASSDTGEYEGWQKKQCRIKYNTEKLVILNFTVHTFDKKVLSYPWLEVF